MSVTRPWLSIVLPTFNGQLYLRECLDSIARQHCEGIELIAVDDGSTDQTLRLLREFSERLPMKIVGRPHCGNWVANTNFGFSLASGEYLGILHQDDCWLPGRLTALAQVTRRRPSAALVVHPVWFIDGRGRRLGLWRCPLPTQRGALPAALVVPRLLVQNFIAMPAPVFRSEAFRAVGGMDEDLWYTADWDLWLKLASYGGTLYCPTPLACFRIHGASQTVRRSCAADTFRGQLQSVLRRHRANLGSPGLARVAQFSADVNVALAKRFHGGGRPSVGLLLRGICLGPTGLLWYIRNSRIAERVTARMRLKF